MDEPPGDYPGKKGINMVGMEGVGSQYHSGIDINHVLNSLSSSVDYLTRKITVLSDNLSALVIVNSYRHLLLINLDLENEITSVPFLVKAMKFRGTMKKSRFICAEPLKITKVSDRGNRFIVIASDGTATLVRTN
jgi:hypothetical protein